jgi:hypothetical protein
MSYSRYVIALLACIASIAAVVPYHPNIQPWHANTGNGIVILRWRRIGCPDADSFIGQKVIHTDRCVTSKYDFKSILFELPIKPQEVGKDDQTAWDCTLSLFESPHCEEGTKIIEYDAEARGGACQPAFNTSLSDPDVVARSLYLACTGPTGRQQSIAKAYCQDPRDEWNHHHRGAAASALEMGIAWDAWLTWHVDCLHEPYLDLVVNSTRYHQELAYRTSRPDWWKPTFPGRAGASQLRGNQALDRDVLGDLRPGTREWKRECDLWKGSPGGKAAIRKSGIGPLIIADLCRIPHWGSN